MTERELLIARGLLRPVGDPTIEHRSKRTTLALDDAGRAAAKVHMTLGPLRDHPEFFRAGERPERARLKGKDVPSAGEG